MILLTLLTVLFVTNCASKKASVLFVVIDDLKPNLGVYGYRNAFTPNLDALANRSFVFNNAFAQVALITWANLYYYSAFLENVKKQTKTKISLSLVETVYCLHFRGESKPYTKRVR